MTRNRYKVNEDEYPYFITSSIVYGLPLCSIPEVSSIILNSLTYLQKYRQVTLYAYVIMENHFHLIVQSSKLTEKIAAFKSFTARKAVDYLKSNGHSLWLKKLKEQKLSHKTDRDYQLWQEGYNPKQVVGDTMLIQKINYIHNNPVKRDYVDKPEYWRYSSARDYIGIPGLIPVTLIRK